VKQQVDYKLATLVYKSLRGQSPWYLVDDCQLIADSERPGFAPLTPKSSLFREQTLDLATRVSRSRFREFGTVYPPHCGSLTLNLDILNDF